MSLTPPNTDPSTLSWSPPGMFGVATDLCIWPVTSPWDPISRWWAPSSPHKPPGRLRRVSTQVKSIAMFCFMSLKFNIAFPKVMHYFIANEMTKQIFCVISQSDRRLSICGVWSQYPVLSSFVPGHRQQMDCLHIYIGTAGSSVQKVTEHVDYGILQLSDNLGIIGIGAFHGQVANERVQRDWWVSAFDRSFQADMTVAALSIQSCHSTDLLVVCSGMLLLQPLIAKTDLSSTHEGCQKLTGIALELS